jgi:hypothetical protein
MKNIQKNTNFTFRAKALEILNTNYKSEINPQELHLAEDFYKKSSQKQKIQKANFRQGKFKLNN